MKKKTVKAPAVNKKEKSFNKDDAKEADAVTRDSKSDEETVPAEPKPVVIPSKKTNSKSIRGLSQNFLDLFWKLADGGVSNRLAASLEIIKHIDSTHSSESQLNYTVGRLVQGLASNRECARHGYYITLVGILKSINDSRLPNKLLYDAIKNRLEVEGSKKERADQQVGQVLAYGALLKSGRLTANDEMVLVINQLISGSKMKNYIQTVAFGFLEELCLQVDKATFKETVWPLLKPEVSLTWEQQTFDTLNLLIVVHDKFPKIVKNNLWKEKLGCSGISDPECFSKLTEFILGNSSPGDHMLLGRITKSLTASGNLLDFWNNHFDPALESPTKKKFNTAMSMLASAVDIVENKLVGKLLQKNVLAILIEGLQLKEELNTPSAVKALESIKGIMTQEDVTAEVQISIMENLLKNPETVVFDKSTNTRFMASVTPSLKKETVVSVANIYRQFLSDNSLTMDRHTILQHLAKLISHPAMNREVDWKASQLVFLATYAYFTPSEAKGIATAAKETFHRALDNPCKKLEDLSSVLYKTFDQLNKLVPDSDITDEVKSHWNNLYKDVQKMQKKNCSSKQSNSWTSQVFLVLYLNMGFELLRDPVLPIEIIEELDACYSRATQKENKKAKETEDPHWVEVVTDILLSLLSRNQHLLRSIVISVWSLLAEHLTTNALQQVLDVIDPSKKDMPLVDADDDDEEDDSAESGLSDEEASLEEAAASEEEKEDDDEFSDDGMDDEEEAITDKLRMKIHEALGDSAALTDTESVDIDDLSDGQMESLDKALGSAFQEFRKARPGRKNNSRLPKDQTALMHFRLRCLDLIEVLTDKELSISLSSTAMMPLLSLLEVTVKEPLHKPLMDRTKSVLRKLTNIRRFTDSKDVDMDDLVKLLQILFSKPYTKRALMPYISEDLVLCCSFILRCTLHLSRASQNVGQTNGQHDENAHVEVEGVYELYRSNLSKYFLKRDSPVPFGVFSRALVYPWPDAGFLLEPLIEYAFSPTILKNRKLQAVQLLAALFRNSTALSAIGQPLLTKQLHSLFQSSQRVVDEAGEDSKPKYLNELFILLRVVLHCPDLTELKGSSPIAIATSTTSTTTAAAPAAACIVDPQLLESFKASLAAFTAKGLGKQKDLKKSHLMLARSLGVAIDETMTVTNESCPKKQPAASVATTSTGQSNGLKEPAVMTIKPKKSKRPADKEKKETKQRRMAASAEGFVSDTVFTQIEMAVDDELEEAESVAAQEQVGGEKRKERGRRKDKMKGTDTNGNQVPDEKTVPADVNETKKSKKIKKMKKPGQHEERDEKNDSVVVVVTDQHPAATDEATHTSPSSITSKRNKKRRGSEPVDETTVEKTASSPKKKKKIAATNKNTNSRTVDK